MTAADPPHYFKALDRSGCRLHGLKASGRSDHSLECAIVGLDDIVQVLAGAMLRRVWKLIFSLQPADGSG